MISDGLEALFLLGTFGGFAAWTLRYIFNHDIIVNAHARTPKARFNAVSASVGPRFLQLDTEDDDEPEIPAVRSFAAPQPSSPSSVQAVVGIVFSLGIALSLELILVLMLQLFASVEIGVNPIKLIVKLLVVLASTVNPLMVIFLAFNRRFSPKKSGPADVSRLVVSLGACVAWYAALSRFGRIASALGEAHGGRALLERKTNEIALLGISITAVLSGIGSASTPVRTFWTEPGELAAFLGRASHAGPSEADINEGIQSYNSTQMILRKRRAELRSLQQAATDSDRRAKGLFHRVQSLASSKPTESQELQQEIASLQSLNEAIYAELCSKLDRMSVAKNGRSLRALDSAITIFNVIFSVYCIYRLINVLVLRLPYHYWNADSYPTADDNDSLNNITKDALAITIAKIIQACFGYLPLSETQLINQVSFILSGSLFLCSFQNVLVTFTSVGRLLPASDMAGTTKSWLKNLILSELLAIYVIAAALLMRSNLPSDSAESLSHILSLTSESTTFREMMREVQFIDAWFDKVFAVSGVVSLLFLVLKVYVDSDNLAAYDEEAFIENKLS